MELCGSAVLIYYQQNSPMVLSQEETKTKFLQKTIIRAHLNKPV